MQSGYGAKRIVLPVFLLFAVVWSVFNFRTLTAGEDGIIRLLLGVVLAAVIFLRNKEQGPVEPPKAVHLAVLAVVGTLMHISGLVFNVHQFQWLGLILLLSAGLSWSIEPAGVSDLNRALFILYWVHPLPGNIFGPLQLFMQKMSVLGSEWLLHCINFPVWANGMLLYSASGVFEVPEACSGMRTLITVLMSAVGTAIILRVSLVSMVAFCGLGLLQVLGLNILRIGVMVRVSAAASFRISPEFLHDTAGIFLLLSVVLVNAELLWWANSRESARGESSLRLAGDVFLARVVGRVVAAVGLILVVGLVGLGIHRRNDGHWATMVARVAEGIEHRYPAAAEQAMKEVVKRQPGNSAYAVQYARCLLGRQKYREASEILGQVPADNTDDNVRVLRVLALCGLGRTEESMPLIDNYEPSKMHPAVALVAAEVFARRDKVARCVSCVARAAENRALIDKVRRLYPYLAARGQWAGIAATDRRQPYNDEQQMLAALKAHLMLGHLDNAEDLLRRNRQLWDCKPAFIPLLAHMAVRSSAAQWRAEFERCFKACLADLPVDELGSYIEACFCIDRLDLASIACRRLDKLVPDHPLISLLLAKYADQLIEYRGKLFADGYGSSPETAAFAGDRDFLVKRIPENLTPRHKELAGYIESNVKACLSRCRALESAGQLPSYMMVIYADALEMGRQPDAALAVLARVGGTGLAGNSVTTLRSARILLSCGRIHDAYETLRKDAMRDFSWTDAVMAMQVRLLQRLGLNFAAMYEVAAGLRKYPTSLPLRVLCASMWDSHGYTDEALFLLRQEKAAETSGPIADLLERTGRGDEAHAMRVAIGLPKTARAPARLVLLPPAERSVVWLTEAKTNRSFVGPAVKVLAEGEKLSPFISRLKAVESAWDRDDRLGGVACLAAWEDCGRDNLEKATVLHRLAILAMGRKDRAGALAALDRALVLLPDSCILWRMAVAVSKGDSGRIQQARKLLPDDSELWLAWVVSLVRSGSSDDNLLSEMEAAVVPGRYSSETLLRAGDYLLRKGRLKSAGAVSRAVIAREKCLASAYALNMSVSLAAGDEVSALKYATTARECLPGEPVFLKTIAQLKMKLRQNDAVLMDCLVQLAEKFPGEKEWKERLGVVRFAMGDMEGAFKIISSVTGNTITNLQPGVCILMAESARQMGRVDLCVKILSQARTCYPDSTPILNNLVYSLASAKETVSEAGRLLPVLLERKDLTVSVYDTAAYVCFRQHQSDRAREYLDKALKMLDPAKDMRWYELSVNAAETAMNEGLNTDARTIIDYIKAAPRQDLVPKLKMKKLLEVLEK